MTDAPELVEVRLLGVPVPLRERDETDRFCRASEHLLTLASPPDVRAYQDWILGEFVRQTAGLPPIPWPDCQPAAG